ncbi:MULTISPECIES: hypothetical protein [Bacillus cereus group]|nr:MULTISPECIES: hypothetical protein [Bacillus cereus group]MED1436913.1 hypothetical protein [Bacillus mycoides]MED1477884.1 hypothetical protein [Bacillus pseudomycoides]
MTMTPQEKEAYIERRKECMAHCSFKELIADLRGQKELVIKWDMEHKRCGKEVLEVLLK